MFVSFKILERIWIKFGVFYPRKKAVAFETSHVYSIVCVFLR